MSSPDISLIIPVFNESSVLSELIQKVQPVLESSGSSYELLFVDDGSQDTTWETLKTLTASSPHIRAIRFTRNFGKEAAIQAGLCSARGNAAIIIDADLQHPPDLLAQMITLWKDGHYEVVEAVKISRQRESLMNKLGSSFFYRTMHLLTGFDLRRDTDYKLLDRKVIDLYSSLKEKGRFFRAFIPSLGFKTARLPFQPGEREEGKPAFSFFKRLNLAVSAITSFSSLPLHLVTLLGVLTLIFSFLLGLQTIYNKISGRAVEGFTTVILIVLTIGSILMIALGIIGEYIARIFEEVKTRPPYVVLETINMKDTHIS